MVLAVRSGLYAGENKERFVSNVTGLKPFGDARHVHFR